MRGTGRLRSRQDPVLVRPRGISRAARQRSDLGCWSDGIPRKWRSRREPCGIAQPEVIIAALGSPIRPEQEPVCVRWHLAFLERCVNVLGRNRQLIEAFLDANALIQGLQPQRKAGTDAFPVQGN